MASCCYLYLKITFFLIYCIAEGGLCHSDDARASSFSILKTVNNYNNTTVVTNTSVAAAEKETFTNFVYDVFNLFDLWYNNTKLTIIVNTLKQPLTGTANSRDL